MLEKAELLLLLLFFCSRKIVGLSEVFSNQVQFPEKVTKEIKDMELDLSKGTQRSFQYPIYIELTEAQ